MDKKTLLLNSLEVNKRDLTELLENATNEELKEININAVNKEIELLNELINENSIAISEKKEWYQ